MPVLKGTLYIFFSVFALIVVPVNIITLLCYLLVHAQNMFLFTIVLISDELRLGPKLKGSY